MAQKKSYGNSDNADKSAGFVRVKTQHGKYPELERVVNERTKDGKVHQHVLEYLGLVDPKYHTKRGDKVVHLKSGWHGIITGSDHERKDHSKVLFSNGTHGSVHNDHLEQIAKEELRGERK